MKLSIITINYNNLNGLKKTVDSVLSQTWRDFEWILIDGGSTDGSKEYIEELAEDTPNNISYWCSEPDKGVYNAMNKGILKAKGEYLNFMNSGDSFYDDSVLETVFESFTEADVVYGNRMMVGGAKPIEHIYPNKMSLAFMFQSAMCHQTQFVRTSLLKETGYREDLKLVSDWERSLCWYAEGKTFLHLNLFVANFDVSGSSSTNDSLLFQERDKVIAEFFSKYKKFSISEIVWMRKQLDLLDCFEVREVKRLVDRGHLRKKFIHFLLKMTAWIDK